MKKIIAIIVVVIIIVIAVFAINKNQDNVDQPTALPINYIEKTNKAESEKIAQEVNAFVKVGENENKIVLRIKNPEEFNKRFSDLKKTYENDYVIAKEDMTIIYDQSTKTIRDISNVSIYKELEQLQ